MNCPVFPVSKQLSSFFATTFAKSRSLWCVCAVVSAILGRIADADTLHESPFAVDQFDSRHLLASKSQYAPPLTKAFYHCALKFKTVEELEDEWREHFDLIRKSNGVIEDDFAFCHNMPIEDFVSLANRLATINYRVTRVRPYVVDSKEYVAAVWRRDYVEWRFYMTRTLEQIHARNEEFTKESFMPIDVGSQGGGKYFYAIWRKTKDAESAKSAYFGLNDEQFRRAAKAIADDRRDVVVHQKLTNHLGQGIHCLIHEPAKDSDAYSSFEGDARAYAASLDPKLYQLDLSMFTAGGKPAYLAQGFKGGQWKTHSIFEQSFSTHFKLCKEQISEKNGRVPRVINVRMVGGKAIASSIWVQPDDPTVD